MQHTQQTVILMIEDSMVREGLKLLLEDMQLTVVSVGTPRELEKTLSAHTAIPALIVLPLILNSGKSATEIVCELRDRFKISIPAILLGSESELAEIQPKDFDLYVFPEQIKPNVLRNMINEILMKVINKPINNKETS